MDCFKCGKPLRLNLAQALDLECDGIHTLEDEHGKLTPVRSGGVILGDFTKAVKVKFGKGVTVGDHCTLSECSVGDFTKIGNYVEVIAGAKIGKLCTIDSYASIGGTIFDGALVPRYTRVDGTFHKKEL